MCWSSPTLHSNCDIHCNYLFISCFQSLSLTLMWNCESYARTFLRQEVFTLFEVCVWFVFCCTVLYYLATTENVDHFAWGTDNKNNRPAKPVYQLFFCNPKKPTQVFFGTSYYSDDQCVTVMDNSYSGKHILLTFSYLSVYFLISQTV